MSGECSNVSQIKSTDPQRCICPVCGHTTCTYRKPCDMCRMDVRVTALESAIRVVQ